MLTQIQIRNIHNLDTNTQIEILRECAEALGIVSMDEYCEVIGMKRRNVYYQIKEKKIKSLIIGKHIFPMVNVK
jgi:predicted DNA-binding transcriptional regulator AlpA